MCLELLQAELCVVIFVTVHILKPLLVVLKSSVPVVYRVIRARSRLMVTAYEVARGTAENVKTGEDFI